MTGIFTNTTVTVISFLLGLVGVAMGVGLIVGF